MKKNFNVVVVVASVILGLAFSVQVLAQTGNIPESKIAVIYSEMFMDKKTGIVRFSSILDSVNLEFQQRQMDLQTLQGKIQVLSDEIDKTRAVADPRAIQLKLDQLEQMKKDYQRKGEDAQTAYDKKRQEAFKPLQDDIGKALEAYAKAHNINIIIDASQVPLVYAANALDITRAFINDFNSKNPVNATTPPK